MNFTLAALLTSLATAASTATSDVHGDPFETVTISNFVYVGVNGYPQINFHIHSQCVDSVYCAADDIEIDGVYSCDDPSYTFRVLAEQGSRLRLAHVLNGPSMAGDFVVRMNGPIPAVLEQIGTSTADLDAQKDV